MSRYDEWRREKARHAALAQSCRAALHCMLSYTMEGTPLDDAQMVQRVHHSRDALYDVQYRFNRNRYRRAKR